MRDGFVPAIVVMMAAESWPAERQQLGASKRHAMLRGACHIRQGPVTDIQDFEEAPVA
eukprot:SAG11_NODE_447_length_9395_cov_4.121665_5_plen_58_part_00